MFGLSMFSFGQSSFTLDEKSVTFIDNASVECIYTYTINTTLRSDKTQKKSLTYNTILQTNGSISKFWDWHSFKKDSISFTTKVPLSKKERNDLFWKYYGNVDDLFTPVVFKNYQGQKHTVTDSTFDDYIYKENEASPQWELQNDTLIVCGYLCNKATAVYGGKKWTVWYAMEIPISDGPWKFSGLPGLILKATDDSQTHIFEAVLVRNSNRPIYFTENAQRITVNKEQYLKEKEHFENLNTNDIVDDSFLEKIPPGSKNLLLNGKRISLRRDTKYCPLEE